MKRNTYLLKLMFILMSILSAAMLVRAEECTYTVDGSNQAVIEFDLPKQGTVIGASSVDGNRISFTFSDSVTPTFHLTGAGIDVPAVTNLLQEYTLGSVTVFAQYIETSPGTQFDLLFLLFSPNPTESFTVTVTADPALAPASSLPASITSLFNAVNEIPGDQPGEAVFTNCAPLVNEPPTIELTSPSHELMAVGEIVTTTVQVGETLTIDAVSADDNPPAVLSVDISPPPSGVNSFIDNGDGTGDFSFTPAEADQGQTFTATFTATDNEDPLLQASIDVEMSVEAVVAEEPIIDIDPRIYNFTAFVGQYDIQDITIANSGGEPLEVQNVTLPDYDEETDNGYFFASFSDNFYDPELTSTVQSDSPIHLHVRYIPIKPGATNNKVLIVQSNAPGEPNVSVTLNGTGEVSAGRTPFDIIAVLDKSGSMGGKSKCPEDDPETKMKGLKSGTGLFFELVRIIGEDNDKIAVVEYNQSSTSSVDVGWVTDAKIDDAQEAAEDLNPGGTTSITKALKMAVEMFDSIPQNRNLSVLLLTDGRHNTPHLDFSNDFAEDEPYNNLVPLSSIHLYVVGLGNEGNLNADLLKQIATSRFGPDEEYEFASGGYRHTCSNGKLGIYFAQILVDSLSADEQIVEDDEGMITEGTVSTQTFPITSSTQKAVFYVTWQDPDTQLYFRLIAPDGTEVDPGPAIIGNGYSIYHLDFPLTYQGDLVQHAGEWQMVVSTGYYAFLDIQVLDAAGGNRLEESLVTLTPLSGGEPVEAVTDQYGRCRFDTLAPEEYTIHVTKDGYHSLSLDVEFTEGEGKSIAFHLTSSSLQPPEMEEGSAYVVHPLPTSRTRYAAVTTHTEFFKPKTVAYEAALITDDPVVRADFDVVGTRHFTGDEVLATAALTEGGAPLLGADDVYAVVDVPAEGLGEFLYKNSISGDTAAIVDPDGSADSVTAKKLQILLEEKPELLTRVALELPMKDDGTDGDAEANDGIYTLRLHTSGSEKQTEHNGNYTFKFKAGGETLLGQRFERTKAVSEYVVSLPEPKKSKAGYIYIDSQTAQFALKLKDKFGNLIDPVSTRWYRLFPLDPSIVQFDAPEAEDTLNGELVFTLLATGGEFKPYMKLKDIIGIEIGGLGMPTVQLKPHTFYWPYSIEVFAGWFIFQNTIPVDDGYVMGVKVGYGFAPLWNIEGEIGSTLTKDTLGSNGTVFQYSINLGYTLPVNIVRFSPFLTAGLGALSFKNFTDEDNAFAFNVGAGLRWYTSVRKKYGISLTVRDFIVNDAYGTDITNNIQITAGARIHF